MHSVYMQSIRVGLNGSYATKHTPRLLRKRCMSTVSCSARKRADVGPEQLVSANLAGFRDVITRVAKAGMTSLCALSLLAPCVLAQEPMIVRLPASSDPEVFAAQKTMVEAWSILTDAFFDENFNGRNMEDELRTHLLAAYTAPSPDDAYSEIGHMLEDLGDPYTRIIPPEAYSNFRVSSDGELQGVGLLIANEPVDGHLLVLAPIKGGPADRAGVLPGDQVLSINGKSTEGLNGEQAAKLLRGSENTPVRVKFSRRTEQIPGVPGRPEPRPKVQYHEVTLRRERVAISPVYSTVLNQGDKKLGYIRLLNFSSNAGDDMSKAMQHLEDVGVDAYILDLRNNPGGLVKAGLDVAGLWLDGSSTVVNVTGRNGDVVQAVHLDEQQKPITQDPLVVLVNENSASASEILSGALQDYHRATIIGDTTYGKGKIQSVFELQDGSALFVTVARYQTPNGRDIDQRGIIPDRACTASDISFLAPMPFANADTQLVKDGLMQDGCVMTAEELLSQQPAVLVGMADAGKPMTWEAPRLKAGK